MNAELQQEAERQALFCGVFSSSKRIMIAWALADQELSVSEIAKAIEASLQNTSQHLRLMKQRGILRSRREGQTIFYSVADNQQMRSCEHILLHKGRTENQRRETVKLSAPQSNPKIIYKKE